MNPMVQQALVSVVRWGLTFGAGILVQHGIWTAPDATQYVTAASLAIVALLWSLWDKYKSRQKLVTALVLPKGATEIEVEGTIAAGAPIPSVLTPKDVVPVSVPSVQ